MKAIVLTLAIVIQFGFGLLHAEDGKDLKPTIFIAQEQMLLAKHKDEVSLFINGEMPKLAVELREYPDSTLKEVSDLVTLLSWSEYSGYLCVRGSVPSVLYTAPDGSIITVRVQCPEISENIFVVSVTCRGKTYIFYPRYGAVGYTLVSGSELHAIRAEATDKDFVEYKKLFDILLTCVMQRAYPAEVLPALRYPKELPPDEVPKEKPTPPAIPPAPKKPDVQMAQGLPA